MSEKVILERAMLVKQIARDAKGVGMPTGSAATVADQIAETILIWAKKRSTITEADLYRQLARVSRKYNCDLAYVYENHDKII